MDSDWAAIFQAGVDDYYACRRQEDNPYPAGSGEAFEWVTGWLNGREEDEADYDQGDDFFSDVAADNREYFGDEDV